MSDVKLSADGRGKAGNTGIEAEAGVQRYSTSFHFAAEAKLCIATAGQQDSYRQT